MYISSYINNVQNNSHFISIVLKSIKYCERFRHAAEIDAVIAYVYVKKIWPALTMTVAGTR